MGGEGWPQYKEASLFGEYFAFNYFRNSEKKKFIFEHIDFSNKIYDMLEEEAKKVSVEKCVGVFLRGTDYTQKKPQGHPIQPSIEAVIEKIDEYVEQYSDINGIYLVTEDMKYYNILKGKYGEFLKISFMSNLISGYNGRDYLYKTYNKREVVRRGEEYLCKIILLSQCKYLISSIANGSVVAMAFNGDAYTDKYIFDLGCY
ncbi:MAG: hypothetical protein ACLRTF_04470 [Blautia sp.]